MKILYCIPQLFNAGGMERVLTQKVNWLTSHTEHTITILTTEVTPEGKAESYFALDKRVKVVPLHIDFNADYSKPLLSKWWGHMHRMRAYRYALTRYIKENKIDLCISLGGKEIAFLRHMPCRTIAEWHFAKDHRRQLLEANHRSRFWSLLGRIRTAQLVHAVKPLECLVVLTEQDKAAWQKAGCKNVRCIPNPCSMDGRIIPMRPKKKTLLAVGRLHEEKGYDLLIQAWQPIEAHYPDWLLRIVGDGPKYAALAQQIQDLGLKRVVIARDVKDIAAEYAQASLLVLSSRYEGFSLVLSEAMWAGVPCVSFDCPYGPAELLADERGWLVPDGDIAALTAQLEYAITHPDEASERAKKAQTYAQNTYSESAIMPQWLAIINDKRLTTNDH